MIPEWPQGTPKQEQKDPVVSAVEKVETPEERIGTAIEHVEHVKIEYDPVKAKEEFRADQVTHIANVGGVSDETIVRADAAIAPDLIDVEQKEMGALVWLNRRVSVASGDEPVSQ